MDITNIYFNPSISRSTTKAFITSSDLENMILRLSSESIVNQIKNGTLFNDAYSYISNIRVYPIDFKQAYNLLQFSEQLIIGNWDSDIDTYLFRNDYSNFIFDMGTIKITPKFNNFLDYEPYTSINLYLPYVSVINLPVNLVMNKYINISYIIDLESGKLIYIIRRGDDETSINQIILSGSGEIGYEIPLGQTNAQEIARNNILSTLNVLKGAVESGIGGGVGDKETLESGINDITKGTMSILTQVHRGLTSSASGTLASWYLPQQPYLMYYRPNINNIDYTAIKGRPCGKTLKISEFKGYTTFSNVIIKDMDNATESEINKIKTLLQSGIIV